MPSKFMNGVAAKHCVTCYDHHGETPLDVLKDFVDWTKREHLRSYIEISKMLHVTPKEAKRLMYLAALPDDVTIKTMKELMHGKD